MKNGPGILTSTAVTELTLTEPSLEGFICLREVQLFEQKRESKFSQLDSKQLNAIPKDWLSKSSMSFRLQTKYIIQGFT